MNQSTFFAVSALTIVCGVIAYEFCYQITLMGGHLPFQLLTLAAPVGYALGRLRQP